MNRYPYFSENELKCKCGCGQALIDDVFMWNLVDLRKAADFKFILSSAYRCPEHDANIHRQTHPGYKNKNRFGPHTSDAVDILIFGSRAWEIVRLAPSFGMVGIGINQRGAFASRYIHLDGGLIAKRDKTTARPWLWSY